MNATEHVDVPLLLMTSFNTEDDTLSIVKKYADRPVKITTFNQSRYPRVFKDSMTVVAKDMQHDKSAWYPPGHGDMYNALHQSGILDRLIAQGKEYLFVSNSDNLGAVFVSFFISTFISVSMFLTIHTVLTHGFCSIWSKRKVNSSWKLQARLD